MKSPLKFRNEQIRSNHRSFSAPRNFAQFTGKNLCQNLFFNKVLGLRPATLLKKRLWHTSCPVNFAKFLKTVLQSNSG